VRVQATIVIPLLLDDSKQYLGVHHEVFSVSLSGVVWALLFSVHTLGVHSLLSTTLKIANILSNVEQEGFYLAILFHSI